MTQQPLRSSCLLKRPLKTFFQRLPVLTFFPTGDCQSYTIPLHHKMKDGQLSPAPFRLEVRQEEQRWKEAAEESTHVGQMRCPHRRGDHRHYEVDQERNHHHAADDGPAPQRPLPYKSINAALRMQRT